MYTHDADHNGPLKAVLIVLAANELKVLVLIPMHLQDGMLMFSIMFSIMIELCDSACSDAIS